MPDDDPPAKKKLFSKKALDKAASPEQLNELMTVTNPLGWLVLWVLVVLSLAIVGWGFLGRIPISIEGEGILLRNGTLNDVVAMGNGQINKLYVTVGDTVKPGDINAKLTLPTLQIQLDKQRANTAVLKKNYENVKREREMIYEKKRKALQEKRSNLLSSKANLKETLEELNDIIKAQQKLLNQGLITPTTFLSTRTQQNQTEMSFFQAEEELESIKNQILTLEYQSEQAVFQAQNEFMVSDAKLASLEIQMEQDSKVVASSKGEVVQIQTALWDTVKSGQPIVTLEDPNSPLIAVVFFPTAMGKTARSGMPARVAPDTEKADRWGYIKGKVNFVSIVPSTENSMNAVLHNPNLSEKLSKKSPPIRIDIHLDTIAGNPNKFQWTSSKGPQIEISGGTTCKARVQTREIIPITLAIPALKRFFGIAN